MTITYISHSQNDQSKFQAHQNLIGGIWKVDTAWPDGTPHKLFIAYETSLNGTILKTRTHGNTNENGFEFGLRNEGIRCIDKTNNQMMFYEFDVFGGVTIGEIKYQGKNIYYTYEYLSDDDRTELTDGWEFVNNNLYNYKVGIYNFETNQWQKIFLNTQIKRSKN